MDVRKLIGEKVKACVSVRAKFPIFAALLEQCDRSTGFGK
jgi:hypothetical protein